MDVKTVNIERIVKQVLNEINANKPAADNPEVTVDKTGRAALLVAKEQFVIMERNIPNISDDEILVKVEGCGIGGTDTFIYQNGMGFIPIILGREGTGIIAKKGKNVKVDAFGKHVEKGDKIVTSVFQNGGTATALDLGKTNISENAAIYGLLPDDGTGFNGWLSEYIIIRKNVPFFSVNEFDLEQRLLMEPSAIAVHAVERAKTCGILRFDSRVTVQGCGTVGLLLIAVLRAMGIENIIAIDGNEKRLAAATDMGAYKTFNYTNYRDFSDLIDDATSFFNGRLSDFAFQCAPSVMGHSNIWSLVRRGGGLCELGFFFDRGGASINPHIDICKKEITLVGSWLYTPGDYMTVFDFMKRSKAIGLLLENLITHRFALNAINDAFLASLRADAVKAVFINDRI